MDRRCGYWIGGLRPKTIDTRKRIRKIKNRTRAIVAVVPATPPKPKTAAMMAMMRKVMAYPNM
jgi:hypothetical protein